MFTRISRYTHRRFLTVPAATLAGVMLLSAAAFGAAASLDGFGTNFDRQILHAAAMEGCLFESSNTSPAAKCP